MSGGSFNYLCFKDPEELFTWEGDLRDMSDVLASLGYARDAAGETEDLILMIRQFHVRIETRVERLKGVWKAVEWWRSSDWSEDQVKEALAKYRGDTT